MAGPIRARGTRLYELTCEHELERIVAKWTRGTYQDDAAPRSWLIDRESEVQPGGRPDELFDAKRPEFQGHPNKHGQPDSVVQLGVNHEEASTREKY